LPHRLLKGCPTLCTYVGVGGLRLGLFAAIRARGIEDELNRGVGIFFGIELAVDYRKGAEELVGDVGKDGGAAGRNFVFGEEKKKAGEEVVDGEGGAEFFEVGGEGGGGGRLALIFREAGVAGTEGGVDVGGGEPAAAAVGETVGAAGGVVDKAGFTCLLGHCSFLCREEFGAHPGAMRMVVKTRELRDKQFVRI